MAAIDPAQIPNRWIYRAGFPKPIAATLDREGVGGVRTATFERGVSFFETVTEWDRSRKLAFTIHADPDFIPHTAFDQHIIVGGRFYDVLDGIYEIEALSPTTTRLHLTSHHRLSTRFNAYAGWWSEKIMNQIQGSILEVIRQRAEMASASDGPSRALKPMPTVISHAVAAAALITAFPSPAVPRRLMALGAVCSMAPDCDVVGFAFGVHYGDLLGHRGLSHSLAFAAVLASLALLLAAFPRKPSLRLGVGLALPLPGHRLPPGCPDAFTDGGLGVAFFSPFDTTRYFFPSTPIAVSPIGAGFFSRRGLLVFVSELQWVWLPSVAFAVAAWASGAGSGPAQRKPEEPTGGRSRCFFPAGRDQWFRGRPHYAKRRGQKLWNAGGSSGVSQRTGGTVHHRRSHGRSRHLGTGLALGGIDPAHRQDQKLSGRAFPVSRRRRPARADG